MMQQGFGQAQALGLQGGPAAAAGDSRFARDLTGADLSSHLATAGSGGLNVAFFHERVRIETVDAEKNGQVETRLYVAKQPRGDRYTVAVERVSEEQAARRWPAEFAAFREYQDVPQSGTPLYEVPGLSQSQVGMLMIHGLRSVEDLVATPEEVISQIGLDATTARRRAEAWIAKRDGEAETIEAADMQAKYDIERKEWERQKGALEAELKALRAQVQVGAGNGATAAPPPSGDAVPVGTEAPAGDAAPHTFDDDPLASGEGGMAEGLDDLGLGNEGADPDPLAAG